MGFFTGWKLYEYPAVLVDIQFVELRLRSPPLIPLMLSPPPKKKHYKTALFHTIFIALPIKTPFCNSVLLWALQPTPDVLDQLNALSRKKTSSCQVFPLRPWSESLIAGPWRRNDRVLDQDSYDFSLRVHHGLKAMASSNKDISMQKKTAPQNLKSIKFMDI